MEENKMRVLLKKKLKEENKRELFCEKYKISNKNVSSKIKTAEQKIKWLNNFLEFFDMELFIREK